MRGLALLSLLFAGTNAYAAEEVLFNGKDLTGWTQTSGRNPESIKVKDGAIMCPGGQGGGGHLHTLKDYTNFVLSLEFKWGEIDPEILKAGGNIYNAGVFLRSNPRQDPDRQVPFYYQSQIIHTPARSSGPDGGGTGDIWITGYDHPTFKGEREAPPRQQGAGGGQGGGRQGGQGGGQAGQGGGRGGNFGPLPANYTAARSFPRSEFAEKAIGEWNTYLIRVDGDKLTYTLNGKVVNRGTGAVAVPGKIGLECENTPIFFRNIKVTPLP